MDFQDGQTKVIGGISYVRQGGLWHAQTPTAPTKQAAPQTPAQATQDTLQVDKLKSDLQNVPLERESKQVGIEQNRQSMQNQRFNQNQGLRQEYNALPEVKNYSVALQSLGTALKAPDTPQGDLATIYAYAKAADPGSVVREGEMDMATATASLPEKYKADAMRLTQGKRLPPEVRTGLIEAMRQSVAGLRQVYDQQRERYGSLAQQNGFAPDEIVGKPLYDAYRSAEENYITQHGGTPRDPNAPAPAPKQLSPEEQQQFFQILQSQGPDAGDAYLRQFGLALKNKEDATKPHSQQIEYPAVQGLAEGLGGVAQGVGDALGIISNPFIQGVNALTGSDYRPDMGANLRDALGLPAASTPQQEMVNKIGGAALMGGGMAGAAKAAVPYVAETLGGALSNFAARPGVDALISGVSGGSAEGARQAGAGPGGQMLAALAGGAASAPVASRLLPGEVSQGISALRGAPQKSPPPLVDPSTGELNAPMDAMSPAQRMQSMQGFGLKTITPGMAGGRSARVMEQGLNNLPGSAGTMEDVNAAASKELRGAMQGVAQKFGSSRTLNEGGGEVQRGLNEWMSRADKVDAKVYNAIPISPKAPTTNASTVAFLQQNTSKFESNPALQDELKDRNLAKYLVAIQEHGLNWQDLKDFRSYVGAKAGQFRFSQDPLKDDYRALYGALSEDMRASAAAQGPQALRAFERANSFHAAKERRIEDALTQLLGNDAKAAPEKAAAAIQNMTLGGKPSGDLAKLAKIKASTIKSGAWDEIASTLIHLGGQPAKSEGRAFQPATFVNWYADMSEPARAMLFKPELRKTLDQFVAVNQQLSRVKGLNNTSNTTPTIIGSSAMGGAGVATALGHPVALLGIVGGGAVNFGMAKAWTNPAFVRWATGFARASASGNENAVKSQIGRIGALAASNPSLREPLLALQQKLLSGANSNAPMTGAIAASPDQGPQDQTQPQ